MGLIHIFGDKPIPKVLDFFMVNQFWDYSLKDLSEETGVSYRTLQTMIPQLIEKGLVKYSRTEGKAKLYVFNKDSQTAKQLQQLAREADFEYAKKMTKEPVSA